jgi:hypothetical protein
MRSEKMFRVTVSNQFGVQEVGRYRAATKADAIVQAKSDNVAVPGGRHRGKWTASEVK